MKNLQRNNQNYKQLKIEKANHKKALNNSETYRYKRHAILEVIANLKSIPHFGAFKLTISKI